VEAFGSSKISEIKVSSESGESSESSEIRVRVCIPELNVLELDWPAATSRSHATISKRSPAIVVVFELWAHHDVREQR
jgi:hypothetical protein